MSELVGDNQSPSVASRTSSARSDEVLASLLEDDAVPMETLHNRYGPLLELVRVLIGVVPNCDRYLEIWPPAFRTYNILVPNFLNLPFAVFGIGKAPREHVGLGMYVSSRAAECPYCSAHTCSFALRRGASPETVAQALVGGEHFTDRELATIAVAKSLARIPCELTVSEREAMGKHFTSAESEWVVLGVVLMGFLNKFMDAISVELEASTVAETTSVMGENWNAGKAGRNLDRDAPLTPPPTTDSMATRLSVIRYAPSALRLDKKWQTGVPDSWPAAGEFLQQLCGHDFPVLSELHASRGIKAIASVLRENLDPDTTLVGLNTKALAGIIFADMVADETLAAEMRTIGSHFHVTDSQMNEAVQFARDEHFAMTVTDSTQRTLLLLARAAAPSPASITPAVIGVCREQKLSAPAIVELITWLSVLQMLHRLTSYYRVGQVNESQQAADIAGL